MQQFAARRAFFEPAREIAMNTDSGRGDLDQLLMLAIEQALSPPIVHLRSRLQPMRVIVVEPNLFPSDGLMDEDNFEMPQLLPRALPPAIEVSNHAEWNFQQRAVRGEILSDENGRLYEKLGRQIRPIHHLASGPFGEVIDLVPAQPNVRMIAPPVRPQIVDRQETPIAEPEPHRATTSRDARDVGFVPLQNDAAAVSSHRKLFTDPGQWRVVWWGEFKQILAQQLAHPERLRDSYRLPCYVQVIETERAVTIEELSAAFSANNARNAKLYFLTDDIAAKLDLVLPPRSVPSRNTQRPPNTLLPNDRVFRLLVANDPTIDVGSFRQKNQKSAAKTETGKIDPQLNDETTVRLKDSIPEGHVNEWEFKITREEAVYDQSAPPTLGSVIRGWCRKLRIFKARNELRKWQVLLAGKTADEQLWVIHPPNGRLTNLDTREWARQTLSTAGYDPKVMLPEWEIFWRRKGLS